MKKNQRIEIRVTLIEKKILSKKAKQAGLSVSEYLRKSGLNMKFPMRFSEEELKTFELLHEYRINFIRIKNLLKNKDSDFAGEIMKTAKEIEKVLKIFIYGR